MARQRELIRDAISLIGTYRMERAATLALGWLATRKLGRLRVKTGRK